VMKVITTLIQPVTKKKYYGKEAIYIETKPIWPKLVWIKWWFCTGIRNVDR